MDSTLTAIFACLDRSRAALRDAVDGVPAHLRDRSPGPNRWSVAEVLEHLSLVEERFTTIVANKIAEARAAGLGDEQAQPTLLPPHVELMVVDRSERRTAPDGVHPRGLPSAAAWERAEETRAAFRGLLSAVDGLALSAVIHEHPRFGALDVYQWGGFIAAHESRHVEQIKEIGSQLAPR